MVAIKVTQEIIDNNINDIVLAPFLILDKIYRLRQPPSRFNGIEGYRYAGQDVWNADGWRPFNTNPSIDPRTQKVNITKYVEVVVDGEVVEYTFEILDKTQEEIDRYDQQQLDADEQAQKVEARKEDGVIGYDRVMAIIERHYRNNDFDANNTTNRNIARQAIEYFDECLESLYRGNWVNAQTKLNVAPITTNTTFQSLYTQVKNKVDAYVSQTYSKK